jgi:hypothetical protein
MDKPTIPNPADLGLSTPGTEPHKRAEEALEARRRMEEANQELRRHQRKKESRLQAIYDRHLGRNTSEAGRQEDLLSDAQAWAAAQLLQQRAAARHDLPDLKRQIAKKTFDEFVPKHRYRDDFRLGYREFASALWGEVQPSRVDALPEAPDHEKPVDKGNLGILRGVNGELKRAVTLDIASRFGGVSRRAIEGAAKNGRLKSEGSRMNRRVLVDSLLQYFPPERNAN